MLSRILCRLGVHDFRLVEMSVSFGSEGGVEKVRCTRCGLVCHALRYRVGYLPRRPGTHLESRMGLHLRRIELPPVGPFPAYNRRHTFTESYALAPGSRLGSYKVTARIGKGGMGEVYRARDTKLGRDVALKVLPDLFADDPERLARFQREARVLASLNHPNIGCIHGSRLRRGAGRGT